MRVLLVSGARWVASLPDWPYAAGEGVRPNSASRMPSSFAFRLRWRSRCHSIFGALEFAQPLVRHQLPGPAPPPPPSRGALATLQQKHVARFDE